MQLYCLDFETYFDQQYDLKHCTTEEYIRDNRFEVLCGAIRYPTGYIDTQDADGMAEAIEAIDWDNAAVVAHHAQFDGLILAHHFGVKPKMWIDTLSMARALIGNHLPIGLDALAKHFQLGTKTINYGLFKGLHWNQMSAATRAQVLAGCAHDVALTHELGKKLLPLLPKQELPIIDMTVRMFTEPQLIGDVQLLANIWEAEERKKQSWLTELGVTEAQLQSADQFKALLEAEGVEVEFKLAKSGNIPCFAKTDAFMQDLVDDANERVSLLVQARLGHRSTILQSRCERWGTMANRGPMCVYLNYCGAHTSRWSGGDKTNFQNPNRKAQRDRDGNEVSELHLRHSLKAPPGKRLAIIDLSQIECRLLNALAGQEDVLERFRNGDDPYVNGASLFYGRPITKADKFERGMGKQSELMCGFGCGWPRFKAVAAQGNYGPPVFLDDGDAQRFVQLYRHSHPAVTRYWSQAEWMLSALHTKHTIEWGPMHIAGGFIFLPNGLPLKYVLKQAGEDWFRATRYGWAKIYGAKLVENVVQGLARVAYSDAVLRCWSLYGQRPVLSSHDEAVYLVSEGDDAQGLLREFKRTLAWLPACPIDAELTLADRYEK